MHVRFDCGYRAVVIVVASAFVLGCGGLRIVDCPCAADGAHVVEVPIEFDSGLAIIEARIEGLDRPVRLALDTGAPTVIRASLASEIEFRSDPSVEQRTGRDAHGALFEFEPILLSRLSIGPSDFYALPAAIVESSVFDLVCPPIDGLLGTAGLSSEDGFLERVAVEVDRDRARLRLSQDPSLLDRGRSTVALRRYSVGGSGDKYDGTGSWASIAINGQRQWALIDTGAVGLSEIRRDVFEKLGGSVEDAGVRSYLGASSIALAGVSPAEASWITMIDLIEFGRLGMTDVPIRIVEADPSERSGVRLSQNALRYLDMIFDYRRNELRVDVRESDPQFVDLPTQISWNVVDGRVVVIGMLQGGVAQQSGIQLGDELVRAGDVTIDVGDSDSLCASRRAVRPTGEDLRLRHRRQGQEFDVTLPGEEPWSTGE